MVRRCGHGDFDAIYYIINDAAQAYRGVIPADRWHFPYMGANELRREIRDGVAFWGSERHGQLVGVMGTQAVGDVTLIRHAYVCTALRHRGIGAALLSALSRNTRRPMLVGTWADASWAIQFYEKHGFQRVSRRSKDLLLTKYWHIPRRQVETSVVLADRKWCERLRRR